MIRVASHALVLAATAAVIALPTGTAAQDAAQDTVEVEVEGIGTLSNPLVAA